MQRFTIYDTFSVYYTRIRSEAYQKQKQTGLPIIFQFNEILSIIQQYNKHFQDEIITKMEQFSQFIGETNCFNNHPKDEPKHIKSNSQILKATNPSKPLKNKSKLNKRTIIIIVTIIAIIIVLLGIAWSCYMVLTI
eukprot:302292_1